MIKEINDTQVNPEERLWIMIIFLSCQNVRTMNQKQLIDYITPAIKYRSFCLPKYSSAALSSIAVALATAQSSALHMNIYSAQNSCDI